MEAVKGALTTSVNRNIDLTDAFKKGNYPA
jgi:hypothetical protein